MQTVNRRYVGQSVYLVQYTDKLARAEHFQGQNDVHFPILAWWCVDIGDIYFLLLHQLGNFKQETGTIVNVHFNGYQADMACGRGLAPTQLENAAGQEFGAQGMTAFAVDSDPAIGTDKADDGVA